MRSLRDALGFALSMRRASSAWIAKVWSGICPPSIEDGASRGPFDVDASHAKLGEHFRMRYLVLMFREMFPLVEWARGGQWLRAWRAGRVRGPIGSGIRRARREGSVETRGTTCARGNAIIWRNIKFI